MKLWELPLQITVNEVQLDIIWQNMEALLEPRNLRVLSAQCWLGKVVDWTVEERPRKKVCNPRLLRRLSAQLTRKDGQLQADRNELIAYCSCHAFERLAQ